MLASISFSQSFASIVLRIGRRRESKRFISSSSTSTVHVHKSNGNNSNEKGPNYLPNNDDTTNTTSFVDFMVLRTKNLMLTKGNDNICNHHVIAYSGGIDSTLVTALINLAKNDINDKSVTDKISLQAVLGVSPAVPKEQIDLARDIASTSPLFSNVNYTEVITAEGQDEDYIKNDGSACLTCKTHLYTSLQSIIDHIERNSSDDKYINNNNNNNNNNNSNGQHLQNYQLYNGTNKDDLNDKTRLGLIAASNYNVISPISILTKDDVRRVARHIGLPNWNYASSPCLRSRLAINVRATEDHLRRIEHAERFVRSTINLKVNDNLRVRLLSGNRSVIELDLHNISVAEKNLHDHFKPYFVQKLNFSSVNIRPFKSGSVAPKTEKQQQRQQNNVNILVENQRNFERQGIA